MQTGPPFEWQDDYYAVSVGDTAVDSLRAYIRGQEEHQKKKAFSQECRRILERSGFSKEELKPT